VWSSKLVVVEMCTEVNGRRKIRTSRNSDESE
jgi:hypothetical protein